MPRLRRMWQALFRLAMKEAWRSDPATHPRLPEPLDPFGNNLRCDVELTRGPGLAQTTLHHTAHHGLSTFRRQRRILVDVHLILPGTLKLRNLSFLGSDRMDNLLKDHS